MCVCVCAFVSAPMSPNDRNLDQGLNRDCDQGLNRDHDRDRDQELDLCSYHVGHKESPTNQPFVACRNTVVIMTVTVTVTVTVKPAAINAEFPLHE